MKVCVPGDGEGDKLRRRSLGGNKLSIVGWGSFSTYLILSHLPDTIHLQQRLTQLFAAEDDTFSALSGRRGGPIRLHCHTGRPAGREGGLAGCSATRRDQQRNATAACQLNHLVGISHLD